MKNLRYLERERERGAATMITAFPPCTTNSLNFYFSEKI
jgi:hypothetical protein